MVRKDAVFFQPFSFMEKTMPDFNPGRQPRETSSGVPGWLIGIGLLVLAVVGLVAAGVIKL